MKDRLKEFLTARGLNARQFAEEIDIQPSSVSHMLSGRNKPSVEVLQKMLKVFPDMDLHYFLTGSASTQSRLEERPVPSVEALPKSPEVINEDPVPDKSDTNVTSRGKTERVMVFYTDGSFTEYFPR